MEEPGRETPGAKLRALMIERHAAFAREMWALFETTVVQLEEEVHVLQEQNEEQRCVLEETQKRRREARNKAKRTNPKKDKPKPVLNMDTLTENSSDSEHEWKRPNHPKEEEEETAVTLEVLSDPEEQTENSSDSEGERGPREKPQDPERVGVPSDPQTENSSDSESERKGKPASSGLGNESPAQKKRRRKKKEKLFECSVCQKSFNYKPVLRVHMLSHDSSRPYECSECGFSFTRKHHLDRHMEIHEQNRPAGTGLEEPPEGPRSPSPAAETEDWTVPVPFDGENWMVPVPSDDEDAVEFEDPAVEEMGDIEQEPQSQRPQCLQCGKSFSTPSNMAKHIRTLHSKKPSLARKLQVQVRWRHQHLQCSLCDRRFRFQTELTGHMKSAHSAKEKKTAAAADKPFQCEFCQKSFRDRSYLQEHIRIHTGEKPYRCLICGKYFTFRKSHNAHMKLHESPG